MNLPVHPQRTPKALCSGLSGSLSSASPISGSLFSGSLLAAALLLSNPMAATAQSNISQASLSQSNLSQTTIAQGSVNIVPNINAPSDTGQGVPLQVQPYQAAPATTPIAKPAARPAARPATVAAKATQKRSSVWNSVDVTDGGFKILMPGEVDRKVSTIQIGDKSVEQTLLLATQAKHNAFYMVAWSDLSVGESLSEAETAKILDGTKTSFLRSFKGQLTEQIKFKLAGNSGMQYVMNSQVRGRPVTITSRSYLVKGRLYHVLAAIPKRVEPHLTGSTKGFLKSFQLRPIERDEVQVQAGNL